MAMSFKCDRCGDEIPSHEVVYRNIEGFRKEFCKKCGKAYEDLMTDHKEEIENWLREFKR